MKGTGRKEREKSKREKARNSEEKVRRKEEREGREGRGVKIEKRKIGKEEEEGIQTGTKIN